MARAMQVIGFAAVASADMGPSARQLRGYAANSTSLASASDCSSFCCWRPAGECSDCGTDWNNRMYAPGCHVECSGPNCGPGKAHQYYNTQFDWDSSCSTRVCGSEQGGLSSGPSYYCGGTWNGNNNWGSNYEGPIVNTDTETCKRLCGMSGSNKCTGWTVTNNNECYLKTSVGDMQSDAGVQGSGYCYPSCGDQQNQQNNDGHNYEGPIQVQNAEFCKVRCQASGGQCKGWTVTNNGECYLKDSVGPMRPDGGVQASGNC
ncbi:unnamed protein product [Prorocentrum cordatum]|uniref:Apple domain-containing protein n=2 Tax=Prorocentrum cordatum TaxID=2364126 RepID=A0ABN9RM93_9DINO|nr:unnamed protein product [Polarella glacialis]